MDVCKLGSPGDVLELIVKLVVLIEFFLQSKKIKSTSVFDGRLAVEFVEYYLIVVDVEQHN